ncbi:MAG: phosphate ABC transporter permease PstA [Gammaproteobacteria bacterium]|nr:phosphate ABC transporter permease PstA [Gammaproteobacteria bacterium]NND36963.1 phosphate ABC transporter permease PstA [Gammaproteobacteria bacterium]
MSGEDTRKRVEASLKSRYRRENRFRLYGVVSIVIGISFLGFLFFTIVGNGIGAFQQTFIQLDIEFDSGIIDPDGTRDEKALKTANYSKLIQSSLLAMFPEASGRRDRRALKVLVSGGASYELRDIVLRDPEVIGTTQSLWLLADDEVDMFYKGYIDRDVEQGSRRFKDNQIGWLDALAADGRVRKQFNTIFFTAGDSREPELAGIWGATKGSFFMLLVTLILSFPLGVAAALYLEEFAPRNRWVDLIEVNINNLAAVPSIVFGLLGLAVFINFIGLPRSAPLVGGLVLTLMTLPVVIIAARAAIKSVPPSVREAALGVGASHMQTVFHHVLPLAMPGMLTGAIIGMARALGESAPLLMIGMIAFIVEVPGSPLDPATALPVQVYLWADSPERAFVERTSAAIMVLLAFLLVMNASAVWLRNRFERRW